MPDWLQPAIEILQAAGVVGLLIFALYGGGAKWWVYGWLYQERCLERDAWRDTARGWEDIARKALDRIEELVKPR